MSNLRASLRLGLLITATGGFLDSYAFMTRDGVFAGAQSGNIVQLAIHVARWDGSEVIRLLAPILGFVAGTVLVAVIGHDRLRPVVRDAMVVALVIEVALLALVGLIPATVSDAPVSAIVAFAAGIQLSTFRHLRQWSFSTTMTTVNLVNTVSSVVSILLRPDAAERARAAAFGAIVGAFLSGALLGGIATRIIGDEGILVSVPLLLIALGWLLVDGRET
jgi:uncharacterized membrane protein YoaK (UPF0700 family)